MSASNGPPIGWHNLPPMQLALLQELVPPLLLLCSQDGGGLRLLQERLKRFEIAEKPANFDHELEVFRDNVRRILYSASMLTELVIVAALEVAGAVNVTRLIGFDTGEIELQLLIRDL